MDDEQARENIPVDIITVLNGIHHMLLTPEDDDDYVLALGFLSQMPIYCLALYKFGKGPLTFVTSDVSRQ